MNEIERYLAEEIALDHADGLITRRDALHRLALLGVVAAAPALLAGCAKEQGGAAVASSGEASAPAASAPGSAPAGAATPAPGGPTATAPRTTAIQFAGPEGRALRGAWATPERPRGAVLVIHENKGLTDHVRSIAGRLSGVGYAALAIDLLSAEGGTAALGDAANATAALGKIPPERFVADMRAGLDELARRAPSAKLAAIGFCFGGGMTWRLVAARDPRLAAAVPFYGPLPEGADLTGSKAAVLAVYAERDARVNASRDAAGAALEEAKLVHEVVTYPGVDHAFFNDTSPRYDAAAATQAWSKVQDWLGLHLR